VDCWVGYLEHHLQRKSRGDPVSDTVFTVKTIQLRNIMGNPVTKMASTFILHPPDSYS